MKLSEIKIGMRLAVMEDDSETVRCFGTVKEVCSNGAIVTDHRGVSRYSSAVHLRRVKPKPKLPEPPVKEIWVNVYDTESFYAWRTKMEASQCATSNCHWPAVRFTLDDPRWPKRGGK